MFAYSGSPTCDPVESGRCSNVPAFTRTGPSSKFQVQPTPGNCDPTRAATAHAGGIQVGLADGSVRSLAPSMNPDTWWYAVTPAGGEVSLEVRKSNLGAQAMYERFGFRPVGVRRGYYVETGEDAIVMWVEGVDLPRYREVLEGLRAKTRGAGGDLA